MSKIANQVDSRYRNRLAIVLLLSAAVSGCSAEAERQALAARPETQTKVNALIEKSLKQLVPIKGGNFWLGDYGQLMRSEGEGKFDEFPHPGPDLRPEDNFLPLTPEKDNKPPRWVTLDSFYMQAYKVTYDDFDVYVAANALPPHPPQGDESYHRIWTKARTSGAIPAGVKWQQAKDYCFWLGKITGLPFDLPTEAQWEYAASNGQNNARRPYPTPTGLLEENLTHPSFKKKEELIGQRGALYPVGLFSASPVGLYDLVGNGFDWVNDWYAPDAYAHGDSHNPRGPATGNERVLRGQSPGDGWSFGFPHVWRFHEDPALRKYSDGTLAPYVRESFRCVVNLEKLPSTLKQ